MRTPPPYLKAQTASELAIFGAIFIFVLGLIIRYAVNFNYTQNQSLEAMRLAMRESFLTSEGGSASKNVASVLFIEDRKDVEVSGGSPANVLRTSRAPYVVSGTGSFTKHLFMGTDYGNNANLPLMDLFINGKHLTLRTAGFKQINLTNDSNNPTGPANILPGTNQYKWDPACFTDINGNPQGCVILYTRIPNPDKKGRYCVISSATCDVNDRFNLDRDINTTCAGCANGADVPPGKRPNFGWQWYPVKATTKGISIDSGLNTSLDADGDLKEEQILKFKAARIVQEYSAQNNPNDRFGRRFFLRGTEAVTILYVIDSQWGDIDFSYNSWDEAGGYTPATGARTPPPRPGLGNEVTLYSTSPGGGYYLIEEGKLYGPSGQFIRNTTRHDKVDIIERTMQLTKDTDRLCNAASAPVAPIEACNNCIGGANVFKTCFDEGSKILYIRSRISDLSGRKLITDVSRDKMIIK